MIVRSVSVPMGTAVLLANTGFGDPLKIQNIGGGVLYVGQDSNVTNLNGWGVGVWPALYSEIDLTNYGGQVWGYATGAAADVRIIEQTSG